MALVDKKVKPFKLNAFKPGAEDFVTVSSDDLNGKWSVFFFIFSSFNIRSSQCWHYKQITFDKS